MKQILQNLQNGKTQLVEVPHPAVKPGKFIIQTYVSLISSGTERMLVEFGKAGYFEKARQQPEKLKQVMDKFKTDGLMPTIEAVRSKLGKPLPLGYSNVGRIVDAGFDLKSSGFQLGDRVVSNGPHAEVVCVPRNFCQKIPDNVSDEEAAFTVVGAIGLQGIRLAQPTLGELFVVTGLGLIGQLTMQLLMAHGCKVIGIDYDSSKCRFAKNFGAKVVDLSKGEDPVESGMNISQGIGVDGVIITASTKSSEPIHQAAQMCRKRGRIILVGVTGLDIRRSDFQDKELTFQVSNSYGPGRYDPQYEEKGHDYPLGYVRWTAQRNFEAILDMMSDNRLDVEPLITHRFPFEQAPKAYEMMAEGKEQYLGILLEYQKTEDGRRKTEEKSQKTEESDQRFDERTVSLRSGEDWQTAAGVPVVGFIGAGNYASRVLIPAFRCAGVKLKTIVTSGGTSGATHGKKAGFVYASTDVEAMLADEKVNIVVVATRHNTHADFVIKALKAGKHVFVEKPLCLTTEELEEIRSRWAVAGDQEPVDSGKEDGLRTTDYRPLLMVGFNRRFSPQLQKMKVLLDSAKEPKSFIMTINAGPIPADHWTQDLEVGGGRIIGEACHFIDLMRFLSGSEIVSIQGRRMGYAPGVRVAEDKAAIVIGFADGSFGTIHYLANGHISFPKERVEVFCEGRILQLDNFRKLKGFGWPGFKKMNLWQQDKGQEACVKAFVRAVQNGGPAPIAAEEIFEVARVSIKAVRVLGLMRDGCEDVS